MIRLPVTLQASYFESVETVEPILETGSVNHGRVFQTVATKDRHCDIADGLRGYGWLDQEPEYVGQPGLYEQYSSKRFAGLGIVQTGLAKSVSTAAHCEFASRVTHDQVESNSSPITIEH